MTFMARFGLLLALSFFFISMALALVNLPTPLSTPRPSQTAAHMTPEPTLNLPQSVLHYPGLEQAEREGRQVVHCYVNSAYEKWLDERRELTGAVLTASARMGSDKLEIYTAPDGAFFAVVSGRDNAGQLESCEVAAGTGWNPAAP